MSGSGRRVFQPGEVLTASNVMSYLQDQAVMVFAGTAARGSALGTATVSEGMVTYLQDTNFVEVYDGTAWRSLGGVQVASGTANRDALLPSPIQGDTVFRNDVGYAETYFSAYNSSTNVGGVTPAGWYPSWVNKPAFFGECSRTATSGTSYIAGDTGFLYTEVYDPLGWHSAATNTTRITPTIAGIYRVSTGLGWGVNTTGVRQANISKNGTRIIAGGFLSHIGASSNYMNLNGSVFMSLNGTTDYVTIDAITQNSGSSITVDVQVSVELVSASK